MRYIESTLLKDEKLVYAVRPHGIIFTSAVIYFILAAIIFIFGRQFNLGSLQFFGLQLYQWLSLIVLLVALFYFLSALITYFTSEYGITNRRILMKTGWISRYSIELFLDKVEAILVEQSIPGRIIGYGTIIIIGTGGSRDPFYYIPVPLEFRKIAQQEINIFSAPSQARESREREN